MKKILLASVFLSAIMGGALASEYDSHDRRVRVHNLTKKRIVTLMASPVDDANYHYNMLQDRVIRGGETIVADLDDNTGYCRYDVLAIDAAGHRFQIEGFNACAGTDLYISRD